MSTDSSTWDTDERSKTQEAKEQGKQVADQAKEEASSITDKIREEAGSVGHVAEQQARGLFEDARHQLRDQGEQQVGRLSEVLHGFSEKLQALQEGRAEDAGPLADYLERARSQVDDAAQRIEDLGLSGALDETRRFARRRPGAYLGGAAIAGLVVGRLARAGKDAQDNDRGSDARPQLETGPVGRTAGTIPASPPGTTVQPGGAPDVVVIPDETNETGTAGGGQTL